MALKRLARRRGLTRKTLVSTQHTLCESHLLYVVELHRLQDPNFAPKASSSSWSKARAGGEVRHSYIPRQTRCPSYVSQMAVPYCRWYVCTLQADTGQNMFERIEGTVGTRAADHLQELYELLPDLSSSTGGAWSRLPVWKNTEISCHCSLPGKKSESRPCFWLQLEPLLRSSSKQHRNHTFTFTQRSTFVNISVHCHSTKG